MSATLAQIRAGIAANLSVIPDVQVSAYTLGNPTPPCLWILGPETSYDLTMHRGLDMVTITVQGFVALAADAGSQVMLDEMVSPAGAMSVKQAVEADRTLGGVVSDLWVTRQSAYRVLQSPPIGASSTTTQLIETTWTVEVYV